ncbi:replication protein A 32 kDa subunit B-like [Populus alba x Populus x berolinensis]|uniref:Replication protein A 32 kDa subunit B-like n=1 Tax=Populus alba x Populus x berolinensis TaxID=444605 RepID=A0AAD6W0B1_9ROSI|nr:replication protein A 32 kDa subunit B-like [Populus alba x Populus x berolinensis]KAJ6993904.1 replication protein A 32 kDa subunit B-like [Populus alba x Populus x berolinensis]
MHGGSEFDGSAAAFMGGGFMPNQSAQPSSSDSSSFAISKNREARCLFPLTVKQINNLTSNDESNLIIDGAEVNNVTIVGRVSHKEDKASEYSFLVDDGTGQIECTQWVQESLDTEQMGEILVGMYVRVHGHLRGLQGRRFLNVFSIRPVTDFNEVPNHFIECIYVHFYNTRIRGVTAQPPVANSTNTSLKGYQAAPPYQSSAYSSADGLNNASQMILNFLQQPSYLTTEGAHYDAIAGQLKIPTDKLKEVLQMLVDNGLVYTTINDDYYKSTVNA